MKPLEYQGLPIDWAKDFFLPAKIQPDKQILLQMDNGISTSIENDSKSCRVNEKFVKILVLVNFLNLEYFSNSVLLLP